MYLLKVFYMEQLFFMEEILILLFGHTVDIIMYLLEFILLFSFFLGEISGRDFGTWK